MRVKSGKKRDCILQAASPLFWQYGYDRVSMDMISDAVGGSKATLYSYFGSKEDLFVAAIDAHVDGCYEKVMAILEGHKKSIRDTLDKLGHSIIETMNSPEIVSVRRTMTSVAALELFSAKIYEKGTPRVWGEVAKFLGAQMELGALRKSSPMMAAFQFKGLIETGLTEPALYNAPPELEVDDVIESAIDVFMRAYQAP